MRRLTALTLVLGLALAACNHTEPDPRDLPRCQTEDSIGPCYWDAKTQGNGNGTSFWVDKDGNVHYLKDGTR